LTKTPLVEWVKAMGQYMPYLLLGLSTLAGGGAFIKAGNAQVDAAAAYDEMAIMSETADEKSDSLRLAFVEIGKLKSEVAKLKQPAGRRTSGARRRPLDMRNAPRPALTRGVAAVGSWFRGIFG